MPTTRENLKWCEEIQKKEPIWVFFSVNPMEKGKRNKDSVKFIQTWITDIDEWDKSFQLELINKAPLKPTFVNESVHGFHLFYIATDHLTVEQYTEWNQWLRDYYNWDQKVVKDTARVLRVPWLLHYKGEPTLVQFREDLSSWDIYSYDEIVKAFPKKEEEKKEIEIKPFEKKWSGSDSYREKVNRLDNKEMLYELSGTKRVNYEIIWFKPNSDWTEQITINWVPRSCWIDKEWMIGSYDDGWPWWVNWLKYYLKRDLTKSEWTELLKIVNAKYPELEDKKEKKKLNVEEKIYNPTKVPKLVKPDFTWGSRELDGALGKMKKWQMIILLGETWAWKTTFATFVARMNKGSCYYVLEDSVENIASRYAMKRAWITVDQYNEWEWTEQQEQDYEQAYLNFRNRDLLLVDIWHKITVSELVDSIKELKEKWHSLFFIDNLWFIIGDWDSEAKQTADISSKLVSLCLQENICIVLLHHFKKKDKPLDRRDISQMRWSWKLWDDAFMVVEYIRDDDQTFIAIYKDRTRWNSHIYEIAYDRGDFLYKGIYK